MTLLNDEGTGTRSPRAESMGSPVRPERSRGVPPFAPSGVEGSHRSPRAGGTVGVLLLVALSGCIQTTGGNVVSFQATAGGDPEIVNGGALTFTTPRGF